MAIPFDINNRDSWAWIDNGKPSPSWARNGSSYVLNPYDRHSFFQVVEGRLALNPCPKESDDSLMVFNPIKSAADWSRDVSEAQIYDWAVRVGLITDQR